VTTNILSIDLEDYFCHLPFSTWDKYDSRIVKTTIVILDLLAKYRIQATFFTVGYLAEKEPELMERIRSGGHEIASHTYSHPNLKELSRDSFEADLIRSLDTLRKVSGEKVIGFRAPYFSVSRENFWVFEVLRKHLRYDSSIFPVGPHYGFPDAPRYAYRISRENPLEEDLNSKFIEIPLATTRFPVVGNVPVAGGVYLRFLPLYIVRRGIMKLNDSGHSAMCYIHPEDFAADRPSIPGHTWPYYWGSGSAAKKFESLLRSFKFSSAREVLELH
jgi:polysaccharide deacetylase family protein (PEP-CTERM system associated)